MKMDECSRKCCREKSSKLQIFIFAYLFFLQYSRSRKYLNSIYFQTFPDSVGTPIPPMFQDLQRLK